MAINITQLLNDLSELERIADEDSKRNQYKRNNDLAEWYDGMAHGLLRAKELIQDALISEEEKQR